MKNFGRYSRGRHSPSRGFSMIELVVVLVVILITSAITAPSFMRAYQYYQVSNAATSMANVIKYTRYEAIRRNTPINCVIGPAPVGTIAWTDSIANLVLAANVGPLIPLGNTVAQVQFGQRGAVNPPPAVALVSFVGNTGVPGAGYRAIIVLPSGSMQLWKADATGTWSFLH